MSQTSGSTCGLPCGFGLLTAWLLGFKSKPSKRQSLGEEDLQENRAKAARLFLTWCRSQQQSSTDSAALCWLQAITEPSPDATGGELSPSLNGPKARSRCRRACGWEVPLWSSLKLPSATCTKAHRGYLWLDRSRNVKLFTKKHCTLVFNSYCL